MCTADKSGIADLMLQWQFCAVCCLALLLLTGCASFPQSATADSQSPSKQQITIAPSRDDDQQGWWRVSFHRKHQENDEPMWYMGTLLAYKVVKPVLDDNQQLELWRFHQRAKADNAGHNFSFIFYAARSDAEMIYRTVNESPLVKDLLSEHYIERLSFFNINGEIRSAIESTSDESWPLELQKSWPYFIMGASQTWLSLIDEYYQQEQIAGDLILAQQVQIFKSINEKINRLWQQKGHHAFLHHLNALFGYQELYILERRLMRF